ncbi:hypothetical protein BGX34_005781 [Mortierella sp. NVP85]|nr:hypothetical protein BGX34_005781 [Mortierella sp. NVP85]
MALTHFSRSSSSALRVKLDLEAALLSGRGKQGSIRDSSGVTGKLLPKLKHILSCGAERPYARSILHGYVFDAWSARKCPDEFLALSVPWTISTDSYLTLVKTLDLEDELLCTLRTISRIEKIRLLDLILDSSQLSTDLFMDLFSWIVDIVFAECCEENIAKDESTMWPMPIVELWMSRVKVQDTCRQLFRSSLKRLLERLFLRLTRMNTMHTGHWGNDPGIKQGSRRALSIVQRVMKDTLLSLLEHSEDRTAFVREYQGYLEQMDELAPGISDVFQVSLEKSQPLKRRLDETRDCSLPNALYTASNLRHEEDMSYAKKRLRHRSKSLEQLLNFTPLDGHRKAFIRICDTIQRHRDIPECPSTAISRLLSSSSPNDSNLDKTLTAHVAWVESVIQDRLPGWQSFVKLKLQFFAIFDEASIDEGFADLVCACDLQWELCDVLTRSVRRHQADAMRMPFERLQLGCEILLYVFSKLERARCMIRDHLYQVSRPLCNRANDPLFGSWDLWRMDLDVQLIATLNQLVVKKGATVPSHVLESLIKVLVSMGQLPWLRAEAKSATLFVTVLRDILCDSGVGTASASELIQEQHQNNLSNFVLKATVTCSQSRQSLLDTKEFLTDCVASFLDGLLRGEQSALFQTIAAILMEIYGSGDFAPSPTTGWLDHEIHYQILLQLLRLRTKNIGWIADLIRSGSQPSGLGDDQTEDISRVCNQLVVRMTGYLNSITVHHQSTFNGVDLFLRILVRTEDQSIDLESRLIAVPLINACCQHLDREVILPRLPPEIQLLCQDYLKEFGYQEQRTITTQTRGLPEPSMEPSRSLALVLDVGRMCDSVLADMVQAIQRTANNIQDHQRHQLQKLLIPALYRTLSVSSRSEAHRLLTRGVPAMAKAWGGLPMTSTFWDIPDNDHSIPHSLGSYWSSYLQGQCPGDSSLEGQQPMGRLTTEEILLSLLRTSELLLRFALDPFPPWSVSTVLEIYRFQIGYDLTADHIAQMVISSIKELPFEWVTVQLDLVLYCFFSICSLSHIASHHHTDRKYPNRLGRHSKRSYGICENDWISSYGPQMSQYDERVEQQEHVARTKAREQLVLAAMHFSEEIIRRHDVYYKVDTESILDPSKVGRGSMNKYTRLHGMRNSVHGMEQPGRGSRSDQPVADVQGRNELNSYDASNSTEMDECTQAWLSSIGPTPQSISSVSHEMTFGEVTKTQKEDEDMSGLGSKAESTQLEMPRQHRGESLVSIMDPPDTASTPTAEYQEISHKTMAPMLSQDQTECLMLALSYLPLQEQQALKRRLSRVIIEESDVQ